jgi:hypothetical protein
MTEVSYSLDPVEKTYTITRFRIVSIDMLFSQKKAIVNCRVYTDKGFDLGYNFTKILEGEEYEGWGNDDEYLIQKCRERIMEELPHIPSLL